MIPARSAHPGAPSLLLGLLALALPLGAVGCKRGESPADDAKPAELPKLTDEPAAAGAKKPVEGAKLDALKDEDKARFESLADQLPSPCGKAHSLRTSRNTDAACGRAPFAVEYVAKLVAEGASDEEVKQLYIARYPTERKKVDFKLAPTIPHLGPEDARVVVVEFFDFGCPACKEFAPLLHELQQAYPRDVAVYFKQYPLPGHPDSGGAAQAALAAAAQGKYEEYGQALFADQMAHKKPDLDAIARKVGLDPKKYEADYAAAADQVAADRAEGNAAGVQGTPTVFINGVKWEGPGRLDFVKMWIDEELALNR